MTNDKSYIDPNRMIERESNGCKVRLFFSLERNEKVERQTLDHLMLVFDRKKREVASVRT
jgi:hypothetical protein